MAKFKITQKTTVAELKEQFSNEVGGTLRIYDGRSEAAENATLVSIGAKVGELECRTSRTVGKFEEAFQKDLNLKVKVYTTDNWVKVLDDITLEAASKLHNGMTKAKMEEYLSYKREEATPEKTASKKTAESAEVPEEYKGLPIIIIETTEIDMDDDDNNSEIEFSEYPAVGVVFHGYESNCSQGAVIVSDDHDELFSEAKDFIDEEISDDEDIPVRVIETTKIKGYGQAENTIDELGSVIGCALNELYDGGNKHYKYYEWEDWFAEKAIFIVDDDVFIASSDGGIDFIDLSEEQLYILKKEIIKANAKDDAYHFSENLASVSFDGKYGYINTDGDFVIEPQFEEAEDFKNGIARVRTNGKYGYINTNGKFVIEPQFDNVGDFRDGIAYVKLNKKYGYINSKGGYIIKPQLDFASYYFAEGFACVEVDGKYGYINTNGKFAIEPQFDNAEDFNNGIARVSVDDKYGYINTNGKFVIEPQFDDAEDFKNGIARVLVGDKYGYINTNGKFVIEPQFEEAKDFTDGIALVSINSKWGAIDASGQIVIALDCSNKYDIAVLCEGHIRVRVDWKFGIKNINDQWIVQPIYDEMEDLKEGLIKVKKDNKCGFINQDGDVIIPLNYERSTEFKNGEAEVRLNGEWFKIDSKGNKIK